MAFNPTRHRFAHLASKKTLSLDFCGPTAASLIPRHKKRVAVGVTYGQGCYLCVPTGDKALLVCPLKKKKKLHLALEAAPVIKTHIFHCAL